MNSEEMKQLESFQRKFARNGSGFAKKNFLLSEYLRKLRIFIIRKFIFLHPSNIAIHAKEQTDIDS